MARLFIAVDLPKAWKDGLSAAVAGIESHGGRPTAAANLHLTVLFCGETEEAAIPGLCAALFAATRAVSPFWLTFAGIAPKADRMIWAEFANAPGWGLLCDAVRLAAAPFPLVSPDDSRPQTPHVTLARFKHGGARRAPFRPFAPHHPALCVTEAELIRSRLTPAGPQYIRERSFRLAGPGEA